MKGEKIYARHFQMFGDGCDVRCGSWDFSKHSRFRQDRINKPAGTLIFTMTSWWQIARIPAAAGKALSCATCKAAAATSLTTMALCVAAEAAVRVAAGLPGGSYTQSCQDVHAHGDDLEARCPTANGDWKNTKLDDYNKCRGEIVNDNGKLRCITGVYGGPGAPVGAIRVVTARPSAALAAHTPRTARTSRAMAMILKLAARP